MNLRIFVVYHNNYIRPFEQSNTYIPLYASESCDRKDGFLTTTGVEISKYNKVLNEGTSLYWLINNFKTVETCLCEKFDYIGFEHYRRWFLDYKDKIHEKNVIVAKEQLCSWDNVGKQFDREHGAFPLLDECLEYLIADGYFSKEEKINFLTSKFLFKCNMFIMPRIVFFKYGLYLNECIKILLNMIENKKFLNQKSERNPGYTLERLTGAWLFKLFCDNQYNVIPLKLPI